MRNLTQVHLQNRMPKGGGRLCPPGTEPLQTETFLARDLGCNPHAVLSQFVGLTRALFNHTWQFHMVPECTKLLLHGNSTKSTASPRFRPHFCSAL